MSSFSDPMKLFNLLKEQAQTSGQTFGNPNILKLQKGKKYALRLLWLPADSSHDRQFPMINQYVHHIWDDHAIGSKDVNVICPTSQYDMSNQGFRVCPICDRMSALYKMATDGSPSADEVYKKFKRSLRGFVPVYVANGPAEDVGKVKILQYTISFKKYFDSKIFGLIDSKDAANGDEKVASTEFDESDTVGIGAFMYFDPTKNEVVTSGHNFVITVGTKKVPIGGRLVEMNDYKLDFSMKPSVISDFGGTPITPEYFCGLSEELHFDEDFLVMHDDEKIKAFKQKYIDEGCCEAAEPAAKKASPAVIGEVADSPKPKAAVKTAVATEEADGPAEPKPAPKKGATYDGPEIEEDKHEEASSGGGDDIDLDELLRDI